LDETPARDSRKRSPARENALAQWGAKNFQSAVEREACSGGQTLRGKRRMWRGGGVGNSASLSPENYTGAIAAGHRRVDERRHERAGRQFCHAGAKFAVGRFASCFARPAAPGKRLPPGDWRSLAGR